MVTCAKFLEKLRNPPSSFLKRWDGNFESEFSVKHDDKFNEGITCSTHFVFPQETTNILTFIKHQMILCSVLKLHIKGTSSYNSKVKNKSRHYNSDHFQHCFRFILLSQSSNHNFYSPLLNLPTLLCCIDLEISPWWRLRKVDGIKLLYI